MADDLRLVGGMLEPDPVLTERQMEALRYLWTYVQEKRVYPLQREINVHFGISTTGAVAVLVPLAKKGVIVRTTGVRGVRITEKGLRVLRNNGVAVDAVEQLDLGQVG